MSLSQYHENHLIPTGGPSYDAPTPNQHHVANKPLQDISARSPIQYPQDSTTPRQSSDSRSRQSLDSRLQRLTRPIANGSDTFEPPKSADEEGFEDVGLNDEAKQPPKKRGIFARFADNSENQPTADNARPGSSHRGFHLPGRKRGQSGTGAELANIEKPANHGGDDGVIR